MPIDPSEGSIQKRNLMVVSLSIIIYFMAGGSIDNGSLKLIFLNVKFDRLWVLVFVIWLSLFWFYLRFCQKYWGHIKSQFRAELHNKKPCYLTVVYLEHKLKMKHKVAGGFMPETYTTDAIGRWGLQWGPAVENEIDKEISKGSPIRRQQLEGFIWVCLRTVEFFKLAIIKPGFGDFFLPHVCFYLAVVLGVMRFYSFVYMLIYPIVV